MPESKKSSLKSIVLAVLWQMQGRSARQKTPFIKKRSIKSEALAAQQPKNEVPEKKHFK